MSNRWELTDAKWHQQTGKKPEFQSYFRQWVICFLHWLWLGRILCAGGVTTMSLLTGSPSTMSPLGLRITIMTWAWKVMISTGPCSIIFPIASCKHTSRAAWTELNAVQLLRNHCETPTSMLSMSRILDWKSSPSPLACWMGWASWLYVWGQNKKVAIHLALINCLGKD